MNKGSGALTECSDLPADQFVLDPSSSAPTINALGHDTASDDPALTIAEKLGDSSAIVRDRVGLVVQALGESNARSLLERTLEALSSQEARATALTWDGSPGGLFLQFAAEQLPAEVRDRIFARRSAELEFRNKPTIPAPAAVLESMRPAAPSPYQTEQRNSIRPENLGQISDLDFARSRIRALLAPLSPKDRRALLAELARESE